MPIYEFFCERCNTVFKFFSRAINTSKVPDCPTCAGLPLKRMVSLFASVSSKKEGGGEEPDMPFDEAKMQKAMSLLEKEAGNINENDPRQAAGLMRKLSDIAGISMGAGMEEAMRRLEHGEDPEQIEEEMGDLLGEDEPFHFEARGGKGLKKTRPRIDEKLYEL